MLSRTQGGEAAVIADYRLLADWQARTAIRAFACHFRDCASRRLFMRGRKMRSLSSKGRLLAVRSVHHSYPMDVVVTKMDVVVMKFQSVSVSLAGADDSKFFHAETQRRPIQSQASCRAFWPGEHPLGFLQDRTDMLSFDVCQDLGSFVAVPRCDSGTKVLKRHLQNAARGQNYCPLDYVF